MIFSVMGETMKSDLTAIILTKNEEINIRRCIESLGSLPKRIVVVDSGSTDKTVQIAEDLGAEIYYHPFLHYADQFNWAIDNVGVTTRWVYRIDADEVVTPELLQEIYEMCERHASDDVNGFLMKHKLFFLGKFLTHGGVYPFIKMTVFKPKYGRFEVRAMGEHVVLSEGREILLDNDCIHYDCKNLNAFIDKHNWYATREVEDYFNRKKTKQEELYNQAEVTKKYRDKVYYRLPKFLRAKLYYLYRYYFKMGFLDGYPGKVYALMQAYFYRTIVDAKIYESEVNERMKNK